MSDSDKERRVAEIQIGALVQRKAEISLSRSGDAWVGACDRNGGTAGLSHFSYALKLQDDGNGCLELQRRNGSGLSPITQVTVPLAEMSNGSGFHQNLEQADEFTPPVLVTIKKQG